MEAVLLHHKEDLNYFSPLRSHGVDFIAHEDNITIETNISCLSFYNHEYAAVNPEKEIAFFIQDWHRDDNGIDISHKGKCSVAQILSTGFWITLVGLYRDYHSLKFWLNKYEFIHVSLNEPPNFIRIAKIFSDKIKFYQPGHSNKALITSSFIRKLGHFPRLDWKNLLMRFLQLPILPLLKNKTLFFRDWTLRHLANRQPHSIMVDSLCPWRGAYLNQNNKKYLKESYSLVPEYINCPCDVAHFKNILQRNDIVWDDDFLILVEKELHERYEKYKSYIQKVLAVYMELFQVYKPVRLVIPGMTLEAYAIAMQLAQSSGIPVYLVVDGYHVSTGGYFFLYSRDKSKFLFDKVCVYGRQHYDMLKKIGLSDEQMCLLEPPLLDNHKSLPKQTVLYDAIIMLPVPHTRCPQGYLSSRAQEMFNMLEAAIESGLRRLAVKIKSHVDREWVKYMLEISNWQNKIDVLEGMLFQHILKTKKLIGGMSSAIAEATFHDIPYYVYEPPGNGYQNYELASSNVVDFNKIARNTYDLKKLLTDPTGSVKASKAYMFDGADLLPHV